MFHSLVSAFFFSKAILAINTPSPCGYAAGTTGGGSAPPSVPSSNEELVKWLGDSTRRVILLTKTFDFTNSEGSATSGGCKPWTCSSNSQIAIDYRGWCENKESKSAKTTVTYKKAGLTTIEVGSNKTLLGKGNTGAIKGKGLRIANGSNVIIKNIRISDINAEFVWGGDAITIERASKVWIDHNYFKNVGRQFIVTVHSAQSVTISDNYFDGTSTYSATCNGRHYWNLYFTGADSVTLARNYLYKTSGRGPKLGGTEGSQLVHIYNNYFSDIDGHALDADGSSKALVEGNYFEGVTEPSTTSSKGQVFAPNDVTTAAQCSSYIGRKCVANTLVSSGALNLKVTGGISAFEGMRAVTNARVMEASQVKGYVQVHAGVGKAQ